MSSCIPRCTSILSRISAIAAVPSGFAAPVARLLLCKDMPADKKSAHKDARASPTYLANLLSNPHRLLNVSQPTPPLQNRARV